jgi:hypothetical protein
MFSCVILLTAAFRPEQDPAITRMLFDLGWLTIDLVWGVTTLERLERRSSNSAPSTTPPLRDLAPPRP